LLGGDVYCYCGDDARYLFVDDAGQTEI